MNWVCVYQPEEIDKLYVNIEETILHNKELKDYDTVGKMAKIDVFGLISNKNDTNIGQDYENFNFETYVDMLIITINNINIQYGFCLTILVIRLQNCSFLFSQNHLNF